MSDDRHPVPEPLTRLLEAWARGAASGYGSIPRQTHCGGAALFVNQTEAYAMGKRDENPIPWDEDPKFMPETGRHSWRVRCTNDVAKMPNGRSYAGLCSWCSNQETVNRQELAAEKIAAKGTAANEGQARRGGFER